MTDAVKMAALEPILNAIAKSGKVEAMDYHHVLAALEQAGEPEPPLTTLQRLGQEFDGEGEAKAKGMDEGADFCIQTLAKALGVEDWDQADGSETWDGDVAGTIYNVLKAGRVYDDEDGRVARLDDRSTPTPAQVEPLSVAGAAQNKDVQS